MDLLLTDYNYDDYFFMASLACEAKRYTEAYPILIAIIENESEYPKELIDLIQICFKNTISPLRDSWLILNNFFRKLRPAKLQRIRASLLKKEILDKLKYYLSFKDRIDIKIQYSDRLDDSTYVLLKRLKADFCRYSYEISDKKEESTELDNAEEAYQQVYNFVIKTFKPISEEVLSTCLNYSVFIDEYRNNRLKALDLATNCCLQAQNYIDLYDIKLTGKPFSLLRLLQKNLAIWQKPNNNK